MSADEQVRPLPERTNPTDERRASVAEPSRREAVRLTVVLWTIVTVFAIITFARSQQVGIPLRDPDGRMFSGRLQSAVTLGLVLVAADAVVRTLWRRRTARGFLPAAWRTVRGRWTLRRTGLVLSGLLGYHVVYACYRNLKSWDAFNTDRDQHLLDFDRALFLGHSPAELLHGLLGTDHAAVPLAFFYEIFVYVVVAAVVGSYYLVPSLGPFASSAGEFAQLRPTGVSASQAEYLVDRAHLLADPAAPDAFASISAFASLHTAFTCAILLVAVHLRMRLLGIVLAAYLFVVMVATIYFGMHFVVDDVAGIVIALVAVTLARLTVHWPRLEARDEG